MPPVTLSAAADAATTEGPLRVCLEVEPHDDAGCVVADAGPFVADVSQQLKGDAGCPEEDCECHSTVTYDGSGASRTYKTRPTGEYCICPVFARYDCIPDIEDVREGSMIVTLNVPDRTELRPIVADLRETGARVHLRRLTRTDGGNERSLELEVSELTEKQREAVEIAVEEGYYETPRRTDLDALATELGVSKSAVSQRLNAVESKLIRSLVRSNE